MGELDKLNCEEISEEEESREEIRSRAIIVKINENRFSSKHIFQIFSKETDIEEITDYTVEAQKIAIKWEKEKKESEA